LDDESCMACILRVSGVGFDVDSVRTSLTIDHMWRLGEPKWRSKPDGPTRSNSGLTVVLSDRDFHDFAGQRRDALEFLTTHRLELQRLVQHAGVDRAVLDFGIRWEDVVAQFDHLPADLVRAAADLGLAIEISHYPVDPTRTSSAE
jgi:hypothetical protein